MKHSNSGQCTKRNLQFCRKSPKNVANNVSFPGEDNMSKPRTGLGQEKPKWVKKKCPQKIIKNVERALGSLLGEDTIFIPRLLGWSVSIYCPPISLCRCLIFKTSILPRDLRHQPKKYPASTKSEPGSRFCAEGKFISSREEILFFTIYFGLKKLKSKTFIFGIVYQTGLLDRENVNNFSRIGARRRGILIHFYYLTHKTVILN